MLIKLKKSKINLLLIKVKLINSFVISDKKIKDSKKCYKQQMMIKAVPQEEWEWEIQSLKSKKINQMYVQA
jgi:hypothetical protein